MLCMQIIASPGSSINSFFVVDCGILFLAKKCMDLINLRIITGFYFFCTSDCLEGRALCISMIFCKWPKTVVFLVTHVAELAHLKLLYF